MSQEDLSETTKFVLSFIQALLKTGYYMSEHPESLKAKKGLYSDLQKVLGGRKEITFVSVTENNQKDVIIDGIFDEPAKLSKLMLKDMAKLFVPKFLDYFERKYLASFSIKSQIKEEEFESFINIMSESAYQERDSENLREKMTLELIKNYIISVSTVFNIDLVGKKRKLPWRVEMALTRLKNDLSKIPLYKNLSKEKITEIKSMVFDDIIRPVKSSVLVKDILINLDLISFDTMGISREEMEDEVTGYFNKDSLLNAAPELLKEYLNMRILETDEQYKQQEEALKHLESVRTITKKVAHKIIQFDNADESLVMDFVKHDLIAIDDLPERNRDKARRVKAVDRFLESPEKYYKLFETSSQDELDRKCAMFVDFLPELLSRNHYDEVENIVKLVKKAGFAFSNMGEAFFNDFTSELNMLAENSSKKIQLWIMDILVLMDDSAIPVLIALIVNKSRLIRKVACEMLIKKGNNAVPHVVNIIDKTDDWYFTRNILMILAEIGQGGKEVENIFKRFISHQQQRVREEAVKGITNIMGENGEEFLISFLKDPSSHVRRKAVWGLGIIRSTSSAFTSFLLGLLSGKIQDDEPIIEQALLTTALIGHHIGQEELEDAIIKILKNKGIMGVFTEKVKLSPNIKVRACETLGVLGSRKSIAILKKLGKDKNQALKDAANNAIEAINTKEQGG